MSDSRQATGTLGEKAAISYLKKNKYNILEKNYRTQRSEIDIIAEKSGILCFIEVKTRQNLKAGLPCESVNYYKQQKIISGALAYLQKTGQFNKSTRFDVIEVLKQDKNFSINFIKNAFQVDS